MMMDSEEEEEQTALVCDNGKFENQKFGFMSKNHSFSDSPKNILKNCQNSRKSNS